MEEETDETLFWLELINEMGILDSTLLDLLMKENKEILSQELVEYYRDTRSMELVDDEGNTKRIVFSAKLVKG